jgi:hypothetical protein
MKKLLVIRYMNIDSDDETDLELGGETVRIKQWKVRK